MLLVALRDQAPMQFRRKKSEVLRVLAAGSFCAPIGALESDFALLFLEPICDHAL
jgi:hypothetical protein